MMNISVLSAPRHFRGVVRPLAALLGLLFSFLMLPALAQVNVLTQHNDNGRTGLNDNENFLTPGNVNAATFGPIFSLPVDGKISAQPLYMSGVNIPGQGTHNVVFVVTLHDSVYAFDADGSSANPLWQTSFLNSAAGVTTESGATLGCLSTTANTEMGILATPTIDPVAQTLYVVAKTVENGTYHFRLHALDVTSGMEKLGGPIDMNATITGKAGSLMLTTAGLNMMNRPGLLLSQGIVYAAFGSNGCDGGGTRGWVVAYDASTLLELGVFNTAPDAKPGQGNIWMAGSGLATDDNGNIFFSTANGAFDANLGTHDYGSSILKIGWTNGLLAEQDYFTPFNQAALAAQDLDVGSAGITLLPDQPGTYPHLLIGSGKAGDVYVLNRDNMGQYNPVDNSQIAHYLPATDPNGVSRMFSTAAFWNGNVYFTGESQGISQYSITNGQLSLLGRNSTVLCCPHTPSISSDSGANGILWLPNQNGFIAVNASDVTQPALYKSTKIGTLAHFNTPTIANGRVYVGADRALQVLGLLDEIAVTSGNGQSGASQTTLPLPLTVTVTNAYNSAPVAGVAVQFSDGGKQGQFSSSSVTTDSSGHASTFYTLPKSGGTFTITATYTGAIVSNFTVTVFGATPTHIVVASGSKQTIGLQSTISSPIIFQLLDVYNNGVPGGTVKFTSTGNVGLLSPISGVTDSKGRVQTFYTSGTKSGAIGITATSGALHQGASVTVLPGPATSVTALAGNNQKASASTTLSAKLSAKVVDQYGNGIPNVTVTFSDGGVGGVATPSSIATDATGKATVSYTLPPTPQVVHIVASASGVGSVTFTATAQ